MLIIKNNKASGVYILFCWAHNALMSNGSFQKNIYIADKHAINLKQLENLIGRFQLVM